MDTPLPHPPHHPVKKPPLTRHHPHTPTVNKELNADHGTHQDRPQPAKVFRKGPKTGNKK
jgi:hypothetical protein